MHPPGPPNRRFRDELELDLQRLARAIYERLRAEQVFAFGSAARGDAHEVSDLDVLAIGPFTGSRTERASRVLDLAWELGLRRGVDAILLTRAELERARLHPDFACILEEARLVPADP